MKNIKLHIFYFLILLLICSCEEETGVIQNKDLIFTHSYPISIPAYEYSDQEGKLYSVRGDSGYQSSFLDTLSNQPVLSWEGFDKQLVSVAIFTEPVEVVRGKIISSNVIWKWNTGMDAGVANRIAFSEGRTVEWGDYVNPDQLPDPLPPGHYYWAVWSWGPSGTKVLYSSRQLEFYVAN
jgi:hypothetical protein